MGADRGHSVPELLRVRPAAGRARYVQAADLAARRPERVDCLRLAAGAAASRFEATTVTSTEPGH